MTIAGDIYGLACLVLFVVCLAIQHFTAASLGPFYSFLLAATIFFLGAALLVIVTWDMENIMIWALRRRPVSPMRMGDISTITSDQGTVHLAPPPSYLVVMEMEEMDLPSYENAVEVTMAEKEKNSLEEAE